MSLDNNLELKPLYLPPFKAFFVARYGVPNPDIRDYLIDIEPYLNIVLLPSLNGMTPETLYIGDLDALNYLMHLHNHPEAYTSAFNSPPFNHYEIGLTCNRLRFGFELGDNAIYLAISRGYARTPNCHLK
ncbi:MAG: hypothetical protein QXR96_03125 [Candidatus Woesearchaeota archaeon]